VFNFRKEKEMYDYDENYDCYMFFDGQNLGLYRNHKLINRLEAQSGQDDYQSARYQHIPNKGPIPEGLYYARQSRRQNVSALDAAWGTFTGLFNIDHGKWKGGPAAWGLQRVWLEPDSQTNTYGRSGFSIHGGLSKGSAGCIDIPWQTNRLSDYLDECQDIVPLFVNYPYDW
jgi:hypothetical protein